MFPSPTLPSSSMERCRMMTGVVQAGVMSGTPEGVAQPHGTGTEYPEVTPGELGWISWTSPSRSFGSVDEEEEEMGP